MADKAKYSTQGGYGLKKCYDAGNALVDIIFVHGLTGNRETTWTDKDSGIFWPEALLKDDVSEARILSYGYDADVIQFWSMASQNRIGNHAQNLVNVLANLRERSETNERPILFVTHSLGGLVVEDAMLASKNSAEPHIRQLLEHTVGIAFMGTPHCGSDLAHWAKIFGHFIDIFKKTNTNLLETLRPESEVLARVQNEFHTMLRARQDDGKSQLKITCFYEELPVKGVGQIVPMHSAILPAYNSIGIRKNHMDMTKFTSAEDPGYLAVSTELWRWVKEIKTRVQMETPKPVNVGSATGQIQQAWLSEGSGSAQPQQQWPSTGHFPQQNRQALPPPWLGQQQGLPPIGYNPDPREWQTLLQQWPSPENRINQGGNVIEGQSISGSGKTVQGNNIRSEKDVTFNF